MNSNISRNGTTTQACAACKYQRRKCRPNCTLAPYFPHDRQKQFLNAHKLFGVGKINNMIKKVEPPLRDITMDTVIYQSDIRAIDPVGGCYRIIQKLQSQIEYLKAELHLILQQLSIFRAQPNYNHYDNTQDSLFPSTNHHYHYLDQMPQLHQYVNPNYTYNPFQDQDLDAWANSIPLSSLTLQDKMEQGITHYQNDQKPILDLISDTS